MESLNRIATELVDEAIDFADELGIAVHDLDNDAVVLDFGVAVEGGIEAGLLLADIQTGGLATVQTRMDTVAGTPRLHVELSTDHPLRALLCAQKAGWRLEYQGFVGAGSGPARLLVGDGEEFAYLDEPEDFDFAVLAIESDRLPDEEVARAVAEAAGVPTSGVFLPTAPVGSIAGSVQMAARAAEVAVFRLNHLGYDPRDVVSASASAPVPPVARDDTDATVRANTVLARGGVAHLTVREEFDRFDELPYDATGAPPFAELLDGRRGFAAIEDAVAPAAVTMDVLDGATRVEGSVDEAALATALGT